MAAVFTSRACLAHLGMPEQPARLAAVLAALEHRPDLPLIEAESLDPALLQLIHPPAFVDHLAAAAEASREGGVEVPLVPASWPAILGAAGAVIAATRHALDQRTDAFAAVRPPGHHASRDVASGFCPVNLVALAREWARGEGVERALIIDWDVHHGNGTQAIVERDPTTRFLSMHQHPHYPGTGSADEVGVGNVVNVPLSAGLTRHDYVAELWAGVERLTHDFTPELILISAGFDSLQGDPLGGFTLEPEDYAVWVRRLHERWPSVPMIGTMEGGYLPARLAAGVLETVTAMR